MIFKRQQSSRLLIAGLALFVVIFFLTCPSASQANFESKDTSGNVYIPTGTVFENVFYLAGQNLTINASMKDDVYLAGANINISGPIEGDLIVAGSNVVINSEIKGDLRVAAGSVTINGKVNGNTTILSGMVTLSQNSEFGKSVIMLAGNGEVYGKINKNLYAAAGNVILNNEILGSAYLTIDSDGSLILQPETNIYGNLEYTASQTANIISGAKIQNEEKFTQRQPQAAGRSNKGMGFVLVLWLAGLLGSIIVGLIIVFVFKNQTVKILKQLEIKVLLTMLAGLVYLIVTPIALLILAVTIIGLPLALIIGAFFAIALFISRIFVAIYVGQLIFKNIFKQKETSAVWSMILGLVLLYVVCWLPLLGWLVKLVVLLWGLGALMAIVKKDLNLGNN